MGVLSLEYKHNINIFCHLSNGKFYTKTKLYFYSNNSVLQLNNIQTVIRL